MDQIANPAPGFQSNPGKVITVEPYRGTVVVRAGDTVIAIIDAGEASVRTALPPGILHPLRRHRLHPARQNHPVDPLPLQGRRQLLERAAGR